MGEPAVQGPAGLRRICTDPDIYQLCSEIRGGPGGAINCYLLVSGGQGLVVDLGVDTPKTRQLWLDALQQLALAPQNTVIFLTHCHPDHAQPAAWFAARGYRVLTGRTEWDYHRGCLQKRETFDYKAFYAGCGAPAWAIAPLAEVGPLFSTGSPAFPAELLTEGDSFWVGQWQITAVETPGHSPGHMCLYLPQRQILFTGDHLMAHNRPDVRDDWDKTGMLPRYLSSLEKIRQLPTALVLPAHGEIFTDAALPAKELAAFHEKRLQTVLDLVRQTPRSNCWQLALQIPRALLMQDPRQLQPFLLHAILAEMLAYLDELVARGLVQTLQQNEVTLYFSA